MPQSAHDTLVLSIVASVLGALVMCLLVARYGLTPAAEEDRGATARRLMITRLGHAFSGVCFVATGVLALVAIGRQAPAAPPAPPTVVVRLDPAAEQRLHAIVADMQSIASRLDQVSDRPLLLNQGTLYPALVRLEQKGWIKGEWGRTESNREAKFYAITKRGTRALEAQTERWRRLSGLVDKLLMES